MKSWQEDLLSITGGLYSEHEVFEKVKDAAKLLGFEYCLYGMRALLPFSNPKTHIISNYPAAWQQHYADAEYMLIDPTALLGLRSQSPLLLNDLVFAQTQTLWDDARSHGLCIGWAQSSLGSYGAVGMLSLSQPDKRVSPSELAVGDHDIRWLVNFAHLNMSRFFTDKFGLHTGYHLTSREVEIMKWTADGKTSGEISYILSVSVNTINFHIKNVISKMQVANKTAAVVQAAMLGLLN